MTYHTGDLLEDFRDGQSALDGPPPRNTVPQGILLLTLLVSVGLLGWYAWHGLETYDTIQARREACLRSDEIRDRAVDLAHNLLIISQSAAADDSLARENEYKQISAELDRVLAQAGQFEQNLLGQDRSDELKAAKRSLDHLHQTVRKLALTGDKAGLRNLLDSEETNRIHQDFHQASGRYVNYFQHRFQVLLDTERREHLVFVSLTTLGFVLCIAAWVLLVQWFRRNQVHLLQEMTQRKPECSKKPSFSERSRVGSLTISTMLPRQWRVSSPWPAPIRRTPMHSRRDSTR